MEQWLIIPDTHAPEHDPLAVSVVEQVCKMRPWTGILQLGDMLDCGSISHFNRHFPLDQVEMPTLLEECRSGHEIWRRWMEASPESAFHWLEGNHEHRIRMREREHPTFRDVISIEHNFRDLIDQGLQWHMTWKGADKHGVPFKIGRDVLVLHGRRHSKYHARWMSDDYAPWTVVYGHVHDVSAFCKLNFRAPGDYHMSAAYSIGHIANPRQHYVGHYPTNWQQAFGTVCVDDEGLGHVSIHPIRNGRCIFDGQAVDAVDRKAYVTVPESVRRHVLEHDSVRKAEGALEALGWARPDYSKISR